MKVISDIRLFKSEIPNIEGNSHPTVFSPKNITIKIHRIVMKLRENGFSLGDFDHLYINFTTCNIDEEISPAQRGIDRYYPWYRYYDVGVSKKRLEKLEDAGKEKTVFSLVEAVLTKYFATPEFNEEKIHMCFSEALSENEDMLMKFKEKKAAKNRAVIYLRYLDSGQYLPLLRVLDMDGKLLLEQDLQKMTDLNALGEIALSSKKVRIKPRKNAYTQSLKEISFDI